MKKIALALFSAIVLAGGAHAMLSSTTIVPQPQPAIMLPDEAANGVVTNIATAIPAGTSSLSITSTGTWVMSTSNEMLTVISAVPQPQLAISCDDDACTVNARDMGQAKALLERIAARSVTMNIDVAHDANCHPVHEHDVIARQDTKPDIVASR